MAVRKAGADRIYWWSVLAALALIGPCCFDAVVETDIGFHVVMGRDVLRGSLPYTNGHSWIARDAPWFPTAWLFDAMSALFEARLGAFGLQLMTFAMAAALLLLLGKVLARGGALGPLLLPALAVLLETRIRPRPHCMTWIAICAVLLACLQAQERGPRWRWISLVFVVLAVNFHAGGIFAAAILGLFFLEAFWRERRASDLLGCLAVPLASLCTPGTFRNYAYLLAHSGTDEIVPVREFASAAWPQSAAFFAALLVSLAVALFEWRRFTALLVAVIVFGALGLKSMRMEWEFLLVAAPLLGRAVDLLSARAGKRPAALASVAALGLCALQANYAARVATLDLSPRFDATVLPVRAARYVQDHGLIGPHFNSFDDGGYLMYALPQLPVFLDGRIVAYPDSLYQALRATEHSPAGFDALLRGWGVEWAIVQRRDAETTGQGLLDALPGWALVYWDDLNEIFVRRDVPRWAKLVESDELRFLSPSGVRAGPPASVRAEADRLLRYSPRDPNLLSARALTVR